MAFRLIKWNSALLNIFGTANATNCYFMFSTLYINIVPYRKYLFKVWSSCSAFSNLDFDMRCQL